MHKLRKKDRKAEKRKSLSTFDDGSTLYNGQMTKELAALSGSIDTTNSTINDSLNNLETQLEQLHRDHLQVKIKNDMIHFYEHWVKLQNSLTGRCTVY